MKKVSFVLLSGGKGTRMKMNDPKQFLPIGGKPMMVHVLENIADIPEINEIVIPSNPEFIGRTEEIVAQFASHTPIRVIAGGKTRQESTFRAIKLVKHDTVIIHEAVRPFVSRTEFIKLIQCRDPNATYGTDIPFTVLEEHHGYIHQNLDRSRLVNIQLPQKFNTGKLLRAHEQAISEDKTFTEDSSLLFHYAHERIKILEGTAYNIKITKPIDQALAKTIYQSYVLGGTHR